MCHVIDTCQRGAPVEPVLHALHRIGSPLQHDFHGSVVAISHPPRKAERCCPFHTGLAKTDTLHASFHTNDAAFERGVRAA